MRREERVLLAELLDRGHVRLGRIASTTQDVRIDHGVTQHETAHGELVVTHDLEALLQPRTAAPRR
jgi:hypothetical protein